MSNNVIPTLRRRLAQSEEFITSTVSAANLGGESHRFPLAAKWPAMYWLYPRDYSPGDRGGWYDPLVLADRLDGLGVEDGDYVIVDDENNIDDAIDSGRSTEHYDAALHGAQGIIHEVHRRGAKVGWYNRPKRGFSTRPVDRAFKSRMAEPLIEAIDFTVPSMYAIPGKNIAEHVLHYYEMLPEWAEHSLGKPVVPVLTATRWDAAPLTEDWYIAFAHLLGTAQKDGLVSSATVWWSAGDWAVDEEIDSLAQHIHGACHG